jgi:hypothetical protein
MWSGLGGVFILFSQEQFEYVQAKIQQAAKYLAARSIDIPSAIAVGTKA